MILRPLIVYQTFQTMLCPLAASYRAKPKSHGASEPETFANQFRRRPRVNRRGAEVSHTIRWRFDICRWEPSFTVTRFTHRPLVYRPILAVTAVNHYVLSAPHHCQTLIFRSAKNSNRLD